MRKPRKTRTTPAIAIAGADLGLAAEDRHRDRRAGRAVVADAAAPRLVAGDVLVLRLERLVARPRPAGARVADRRSGRPRPSHSTMFNGPTRSALLWSIRLETLAHGRLDEGGVRLAARSPS